MRRYTENSYGVTASPLHGGLPTDRCTAEWWIDSPRVRAVLEGQPLAHGAAERIGYPSNIAKLRQEDPPHAREIQKANGLKFRDAFGRGLAVTGFVRGDAEGAYLLEPWG